MCCLSEASSHFVVFVCVNPDRKPSRKMKRRNKIADSVIVAVLEHGRTTVRPYFIRFAHEVAHVRHNQSKLCFCTRLIATFDLRLGICDPRAQPEYC